MSKVEPTDTPQAAAGANALEYRFVEGAERRIGRALFVLSPITLIAAFVVSGRQAAFGVLVGSVLGFFNYARLHRSTRRASELIARGAEAEGGTAGKSLTGASLAFGTVARLALVTAIGYAIFKSSLQSFYGYLAGLVLPVAAMCVEALYEAWHAAARTR